MESKVVAGGIIGCYNGEANGRPRDSGEEDPQQKAEVNSAFCSFKSSEILPVIHVIIQVRKKARIDLDVV